jgi:membrane associated rhomboid family serine protease
MSRLQEALRSTPATTLTVVALCSFLHILQVSIGPPLLSLTLCPRLVWGLGDYYRIITSALYHGGILHIGMNMLSMVAIGGLLEKRSGSFALAFLICVSILGTAALYISIAWLVYFVLGDASLLYQHSVGFSGVLFHLSVLECHGGPLQPRSLFGMISVSPVLYPWVLLVALQFFMPNLSFLGHLAGILLGTLQTLGYLEFCLPQEGTLRAFDNLSVARRCTSVSSFVSTQSRGDFVSPSHGSLGTTVYRGVATAARLVCQLGEAVYVILFGRGHSLNANLALRIPDLRHASATDTLTATTTLEERTSLSTRRDGESDVV